METCMDADGDGHAETAGLTMDSVGLDCSDEVRPLWEHPRTTATTRMRPPTVPPRACG